MLVTEYRDSCFANLSHFVTFTFLSPPFRSDEKWKLWTEHRVVAMTPTSSLFFLTFSLRYTYSLFKDNNDKRHSALEEFWIPVTHGLMHNCFYLSTRYGQDFIFFHVIFIIFIIIGKAEQSKNGD